MRKCNLCTFVFKEQNEQRLSIHIKEHLSLEHNDIYKYLDIQTGEMVKEFKQFKSHYPFLVFGHLVFNLDIKQYTKEVK